VSLLGLADALAGLASRGEVMAYGDLARALALPNPGSIAQLTSALEAMMAKDMAAG
jgi:alkylated DNA nucleotide flippase Atl1